MREVLDIVDLVLIFVDIVLDIEVFDQVVLRAPFARGSCSRVPLLSHDLIIEVLVLDLGDIVHGVLDIDDLKDVSKVLADVNEVHNVYRGPR